MILFIDNYDSFTFNLVSMIGALSPELNVRRNDRISLEEISTMNPAGIVLSPGPGSPSDSGICRDIVRAFSSRIPILGVCLGHQVIAEVFGGRVVRAIAPMHGKATQIVHDGTGVLAGLPSPFSAGRYHSLVACQDTLPDCLRVQATSSDQQIMAMRHVAHPCHGVQFHPESVLTPAGEKILVNFIRFCEEAGHA